MSTSAESNEDIAGKIRSGEFFRESMQAYHLNYHDPMPDRYFFIGITTISIVIFLMSMVAIVMMHPLKKDVPFIYYSDGMTTDFPSISPLGERDSDPNYSLKIFLAKNYLTLWEGYTVDTVDKSRAGIKSQSSEEVFKQYTKMMNPRNPQSPITQFQRNAVRLVDPTGYSLSTEAGNEQIVVSYRERVISGTDVGSRRMRAIITFRFDQIKVNQITGEASPVGFLVVGFKKEAVN